MEERRERCSGEKCKGKGKGTVDNKNKRPARTYSLFFLIFSHPCLFSKRPSFHHRFILLPSLCFPICRSSTVSLLPFFMTAVSFSLLLHLSPSLSLRSPPVFSVHCSSFLTIRGRPCSNDGPCSGPGPALPLSTHSKPL